MALLATVVLLGLVLKDGDLFAAAMSNNLALDLCTFDGGLADLYIAILLNEEHVETDGRVLRGVELFDIDDVTLRNAVLFATGSNNRVHV